MDGSVESDVDVLIVGAGPTGLTLAGELLRRGVRCRVIDKAAGHNRTSRALGVYPRTLELFAEMGIIDQALAAGVKVTGTNVLQGDRPALHFSVHGRLPGPYPFVLLLPQARTEELLVGRVAAHGGRVERGCELLGLREEGDVITVTLRGADGRVEELRPGWVAGCDGAESRVRELAGISFEETGSTETFLMADVRLGWGRNRQETHVWLQREGLFAAMPLPGAERWRLFVDYHGNDDAHPATPSLSLFRALLRERADDVSTRLSEPSWLASFTYCCGVASHFRSGRVFLAGDAAHVQSPFGGHGMNAGIQDACNLAWKLALAAHGRAGDSLLDSYEAERLPVASGEIGDTDAAAGMLLAASPALRLASRQSLGHVSRLELVQAAVRCAVSELAVNYRESPLSHGTSGGSLAALVADVGPQPGDRAPDAECGRYPDGAPATLFGEWRGQEFRLLLFHSPTGNGRSGSALIETARAVSAHLPGLVTTYVVADRLAARTGFAASGEKGMRVLLDTEGHLRGAYHAPGEAAFLVRPDGYIACATRPAEAGPLAAYLESMGFC